MATPFKTSRAAPGAPVTSSPKLVIAGVPGKMRRGGTPDERQARALNRIDGCNLVGYAAIVIGSFRHKGLQRFFEEGVKSGIRPEHAARLRLVLGRLQASTSPKDMDLPGLRLHELKGARKGAWSVAVSGNWRVTFRFEGKNAIDVNYEDDH